jgi:hypothetical protein
MHDNFSLGLPEENSYRNPTHGAIMARATSSQQLNETLTRTETEISQRQVEFRPDRRARNNLEATEPLPEIYVRLQAPEGEPGS